MDGFSRQPGKRAEEQQPESHHVGYRMVHSACVYGGK